VLRNATHSTHSPICDQAKSIAGVRGLRPAENTSLIEPSTFDRDGKSLSRWPRQRAGFSPYR
jgi:hypothetical protein